MSIPGHVMSFWLGSFKHTWAKNKIRIFVWNFFYQNTSHMCQFHRTGHCSSFRLNLNVKATNVCVCMRSTHYLLHAFTWGHRKTWPIIEEKKLNSMFTFLFFSILKLPLAMNFLSYTSNKFSIPEQKRHKNRNKLSNPIATKTVNRTSILVWKKSTNHQNIWSIIVIWTKFGC